MELAEGTHKIFYHPNDICLARICKESPSSRVRLIRWHTPLKSWVCQLLDTPKACTVYVRPKNLTKIVDSENIRSNNKQLSGNKSSRAQRFSNEMAHLQELKDLKDDIENDEVTWYIQARVPQQYVIEARDILTKTPFECDSNPEKTAQILALIATRTCQRPRDAFEKYLINLGRSRTSRTVADRCIKTEEVDRHGETSGLYAKMRSVCA